MGAETKRDREKMDTKGNHNRVKKAVKKTSHPWVQLGTSVLAQHKKHFGGNSKNIFAYIFYLTLAYLLHSFTSVFIS